MINYSNYNHIQTIHCNLVQVIHCCGAQGTKVNTDLYSVAFNKPKTCNLGSVYLKLSMSNSKLKWWDLPCYKVESTFSDICSFCNQEIEVR
jgi:hypothetical protein